jgi:hypothetical protein
VLPGATSQGALPVSSSATSVDEPWSGQSKLSQLQPRHQIAAELHGLFSEAVTAKILKVAIELLDNDVSNNQRLRISTKSTENNQPSRRKPLKSIQNGPQKMELILGNTIVERWLSGLVVFSLAVYTAYWKDAQNFPNTSIRQEVTTRLSTNICFDYVVPGPLHCTKWPTERIRTTSDSSRSLHCEKIGS